MKIVFQVLLASCIAVFLFFDLSMAAEKSMRDADEKGATYYLEQGKAAVNRGEYEQAIAFFTKSMELGTDPVNALSNRFYAYMGAKQLESALADASKIVELKPKDALGYELLIMVHTAKMVFEHQKALESISKLVGMNPSDPSLYIDRALLSSLISLPPSSEWQVSDLSKAIELFLKKDKLSFDPEKKRKHSLIEAHLIRGNAYRRIGNLKSSLSDYKKVMELNPNYMNDYGVRVEADFYAGALTLLGNSIEENREYPKAYCDRGRIQYRYGDYQAALMDFTKAIELGREEIDIGYYWRGQTFYKIGQFELAVNDFSRYLELRPEATLAYGRRGYAYFKNGQYKEALADMNKAIELFPDYEPEYYNIRANIFEAMGKTKKAKKDRHKAEKLNQK